MESPHPGARGATQPYQEPRFKNGGRMHPAGAPRPNPARQRFALGGNIAPQQYDDTIQPIPSLTYMLGGSTL